MRPAARGRMVLRRASQLITAPVTAECETVRTTPVFLAPRAPNQPLALPAGAGYASGPRSLLHEHNRKAQNIAPPAVQHA
jgi:hypothetical protein